LGASGDIERDCCCWIHLQLIAGLYLMLKIRVTLPDGRIVDGQITDQHRAFHGTPVLIIDGHPYSGLEAINEGFLIDHINDPVIDRWINTFSVSG
jgi:hypothetical protein